jgi:hypothetical protein
MSVDRLSARDGLQLSQDPHRLRHPRPGAGVYACVSNLYLLSAAVQAGPAQGQAPHRDE